MPDAVAVDARLVTTGMLPALMMMSAALTAPVSLFLLWLYRRAVLRAMSRAAGIAPLPEEGARAATGEAASDMLDVKVEEAEALDCLEPPLHDRARRALVAATAVYVAAGLAYAAVLTAAWVTFTRDDGIVLTRLVWLMSCYAWPTALAVGMIAAVSRGQRALVAAAYFAMLFAVALYGMFRNAELTPWQLAYFWLHTNAPATVLLIAFLHRRVRAVGPLVLTFMVVAVVGSQVLLSAVGARDWGLYAAATVGSALGLGAAGTLIALMTLGFALFGLVGWQLLRWIGRRYRERRTSDQALTLDAMWLLFGVVQSITLAFEGWLWIFTGLAAFVVYKGVAAVGFAWLRRGQSAAGPTLLLLRVFALGPRSERLFDALAKRWLRAGGITMIAGPDLVASAVEPHEFLDFLGGRLGRRFVEGPEDLERRLLTAPRGPDPDGRFRVSEFFCYADTWKDTMSRLAAGADAVLMDLRSFSPRNQGALFELQQVLDTVPLGQVVFVIDDTTDRPFLEQALKHAARHAVAASPNRTGGVPMARLYHLPALRARAVRGLLKRLCEGDSAPRPHEAASVPTY
jgi:hypothetical protein